MVIAKGLKKENNNLKFRDIIYIVYYYDTLNKNFRVFQGICFISFTVFYSFIFPFIKSRFISNTIAKNNCGEISVNFLLSLVWNNRR